MTNPPEHHPDPERWPAMAMVTGDTSESRFGAWEAACRAYPDVESAEYEDEMQERVAAHARRELAQMLAEERKKAAHDALREAAGMLGSVCAQADRLRRELTVRRCQLHDELWPPDEEQDC